MEKVKFTLSSTGGELDSTIVEVSPLNPFGVTRALVNWLEDMILATGDSITVSEESNAEDS